MEIFNGRDQFKIHVQEKVEKVLFPCNRLASMRFPAFKL